MARAKGRKPAKPKAPDLTEVTMVGIVGGIIKVETLDDLWNWAGETEDHSPPGVALHVNGAATAAAGLEGEVAALSMDDLDNLIEELTKARDIVRARVSAGVV